MHIVIDARFLRRSTGGIGRYTRALLRELGQIDQHNRYTVVITQDDRTDWEELVSAGAFDQGRWRAEVVNIPHYSLAEQVQLAGVLRRLKPDIVHYTNFNHPLIGSPTPFVVTIFDLTILKYPAGGKQKSPVFVQAFRTVLRHAVRRATGILTLSEHSKQDIEHEFGHSQSPITVTPAGFDSMYQPLNLPQRGRLQRELRERLGVRSPYILFVSQWRPHKGILTLLDAYTELRKRAPRQAPQLVLIGRPHPESPEIPKAIQEHPYAKDIYAPGFVSEEDLPKLYQAAEAFIFPSQYEGFGLTPLEAMASGVPVIASNASSLPEVIGEAGILVEPTDTQGFSRAIEKVLTDRSLWRSLRSRGLEQARKFSWKLMAEETLEAYKRAQKKA